MIEFSIFRCLKGFMSLNLKQKIKYQIEVIMTHFTRNTIFEG